MLIKFRNRVNARDTIIAVSSGLVMVFYFYGIFYLGCEEKLSCKTGIALSGPFIDFVRAGVMSVATALATFVGAVLGMTVKDTVNARAAASHEGASVAQEKRRDTPALGETVTWLPFFATILYIASLAIALLIYVRQVGVSNPTIASLAHSSVGFFGGALAVGLRARN